MVYKISKLKLRTVRILIVLSIVAVIGGVGVAYAETYPGGTDNGKTSRIKQTSSDLATLGYGSTSNTPDWGADWNRIVTASKWKPQGDIGPGDVRAGKKFYNGSRTEQTGVTAMAGACRTQVWNEEVAQANATPNTKAQAMINNCVTDWPVASPAVQGDDKKDPVTGLVWSRCLRSSGGEISFDLTSCNNFSWNTTGASNLGKTAIELCSERGNGWRLPTQKELLQAYIDGAYFSLSNTTSFSFWSATQSSGTNAVAIYLNDGNSSNWTMSSVIRMRCVR